MGHHDHGGIIRTVGPRLNMSKEPGEWNQMKIQCQGHQLIVHLNGEQIINHWLDSAGKGKLTGLSD